MEYRSESGLLLLVALLCVQLLALAVPTIDSNGPYGARRYFWLDGLGGADCGLRLPGLVLALPGATLAAMLLRLVLGRGRALGVGILMVGVGAAVVLLQRPQSLAWVSGALAQVYWPSHNAGLVKLVAIGAGLAAAFAAVKRPSWWSPVASLLAALAAATYLLAPAWNPLHIQAWTDQLGQIWDTQVFDDGRSFGVDLAVRHHRYAAEASVGLPFKISWIQYLAKGVLWLLGVADTLAMTAVVVVGLAASVWRSLGSALVVAAAPVALAGASIVVTLVWNLCVPGFSFGDCLIFTCNQIQWLLTTLGFCALPFLGLGLACLAPGRSRSGLLANAGLVLFRSAVLVALAGLVYAIAVRHPLVARFC